MLQHKWMGLSAAVLIGCGLSLVPGGATAVPEADHVRLDCSLLRLRINDYTLRYQLKLLVTISAPDEAELAGADQARLTVTEPGGQVVLLDPLDSPITPKQFKVAHAKLLFKAIEDTAAPSISNVPPGFFTAQGPYKLVLELRGQDYRGEVSFGEQLAMHVEQEGASVENFCLRAEAGMAVYTEPAAFGPVYYRRQDLTNFFFQLANMDQALEGGDYHAPVESPKYVFQVRVGSVDGGPTRLVDPAQYIEGYEDYLIRSDRTATPLHFEAGQFALDEVVVVDFMRQDTLPANSVFSGAGARFSDQVVIQDRVVYALCVEAPPSPEELGVPADAAGEAAAVDGSGESGG